jgi:hypothetical protein
MGLTWGAACYPRIMKPMTGEEFLAWEVRQEGRYEFDGFPPVAMTGGGRSLMKSLVKTFETSLAFGCAVRAVHRLART